VLVVELTEQIIVAWVAVLEDAQTLPGDHIPEGFHAFVEDELGELDLTAIVVSKRHMMSTCFHATYQLEHLFGGFAGMSLAVVLEHLQRFNEDDCANERDRESEPPSAARADATEPEDGAASRAAAPDSSLEQVIAELSNPEGQESLLKVDGLAPSLFQVIAARILLPTAAGCNLKNGEIPLRKVINNLYASQEMFAAVAA
jgi:hypothetical protein